MAQGTYIAVVSREEGEVNWSILFPDFPEIASCAESQADIAAQARDALETAIDARNQEKESLPVASDWIVAALFARDNNLTPPIYLAVSVELPSEPVRINVSIDRALLARIDKAAEKMGMTRSGFLAEGSRRLMESRG